MAHLETRRAPAVLALVALMLAGLYAQGAWVADSFVATIAIGTAWMVVLALVVLVVLVVQYDVPAGLDLGRYSTVMVYCRAFSAGFARAQLQ